MYVLELLVFAYVGLKLEQDVVAERAEAGVAQVRQQARRLAEHARLRQLLLVARQRARRRQLRQHLRLMYNRLLNSVSIFIAILVFNRDSICIEIKKKTKAKSNLCVQQQTSVQTFALIILVMLASFVQYHLTRL